MDAQNRDMMTMVDSLEVYYRFIVSTHQCCYNHHTQKMMAEA